MKLGIIIAIATLVIFFIGRTRRSKAAGDIAAIRGKIENIRRKRQKKDRNPD